MRRILPATALGAMALLVVASPAFAHSEFEPSAANAGDTVEFELTVANEDPDAATTTVELAFPEDVEVIVAELPTPEGWTVTVDGEVGGPVAAITWEGGSEPEDLVLPMTLGPLPDEAGRLQFRLIQTYDNGEEVAWIADWPEGAEEPENPGPVIDILPAGEALPTGEDEHDEAEEEEGHADDEAEDEEASDTTVSEDAGSDDDSSSTGVIVGVVAVAAVLAGAGFLYLRSRRG